MAKSKSVYICQSCGHKSPQWMGQCPECNDWNTFVETVVDKKRSGGIGGKRRSRTTKPLKLKDIKRKDTKRISSSLSEFDRVLGGGFVPGQVILIAGTPGIGKSTLLTQIAKQMPQTNVAYVCGEESPSQIKIRTDRMSYDADNLFLVPDTNVESVISSIDSFDQGELGLIIVDSIQSLDSEDLTGMAGSVGQVRGCTSKIVDEAKRLNVPAILVGHVTKEGTVAGPMVLEHMVDTVLYLEGDANHLFRVLKTTKNRFGPVSEVGIFEMVGSGMQEVKNPSKLFLEEKQEKTAGACTTVVMEGFRPLLFEIQALTVRTSFGYPKRTASGYNVNRLHVLLATLEKRCGLSLSEHDVYISVSGGYKVSEYSCDLAVCLAVASSVKDKPVKPALVAFGECDLSGGVRKVPYQDIRTKEAKKLGYSKIVSPATASTINQAIKRSLTA